MRWFRRVSVTAMLALIFADGDSNSDSDSGASDSGSSDSGDTNSGFIGSVSDTSFMTNTVGTTGGGGSSDSTSSDRGGGDGGQENPSPKRKLGEPGITAGLEERDLTDIPYKSGGDSPIKR